MKNAKELIILDLTNPQSIVDSLQPSKFSPTWAWRKVKQCVRFIWFYINPSPILLRLKALVFAIDDFIVDKVKAALSFVIAISNGLAVIWELFACAFLWFHDKERIKLIKETQLLRQATFIGGLISVVCALYVIQNTVSIYVLVFLAYQTIRVVRFFGNAPEKKIEETKVKPEVTRSVKSYEEIIDQDEDDYIDSQFDGARLYRDF